MLAASGMASKSPSTTGGTVSGVSLHRQRGAPGLLALNLKRKGPVRFVVRNHEPPDRRFKLHDERRAPRQTGLRTLPRGGAALFSPPNRELLCTD
jgi:hypothetical protein